MYVVQIDACPQNLLELRKRVTSLRTPGLVRCQVAGDDQGIVSRYGTAVGSTEHLSATQIDGRFSGSPGLGADDSSAESRIQRGFQIAPVPLNLAGKNLALVGLGSYIMNAASDCNSCHNGGQPPDFDFLPGHNPYQFIPGTNLPQPK